MRAQLFVMQAHPRGRSAFPAGVILKDVDSDHCYGRVRTAWAEFSDDEDIEVLEAFGAAFRAQLDAGQADLLNQLIENGSHVLRIEDQGTIEIESPERELALRADELGIR